MDTGRMKRPGRASSAALCLALWACGSNGDDNAAGQAAGSGGMPSAGAMASAGVTGGMTPVGGEPSAGAMASGGTTGGDGMSSPGGFGGAGGAAGGDGGDGGDGGSSPPADAGSELDPEGISMLPPTLDYAAPGPFATTTEANAGPGRRYTIFRPEPLGEDGFLHSPLIFGPGIITTPAQYTALLTHLASHGFVVICVNSLTRGPNAPENLAAMEEGLDWLIAQHATAGVYQGKLAVERAVTMGYSIGSTASVQLAAHPAILTTVAIHGHSTSGDPHGPVLLLTGTSDVIGDVRRTLGTLDEAPAVLMALPIGHLAVLAELAATGRYFAPITAWLRYWVNGDDDAKRYFWGAGCEMCSAPWITPEGNALWDAQSL